MKHFRLILVAGIIVLCIVILSACKSRSSKGGDASPGTSVSSENGFTIRYCPKWQPHAQFAGIYMAMEKGFYAQYGLDVKMLNHIHSSEAIDSLAAGYLDVIHIDLLAAILANSAETKVVNIGQNSQKNTMLLVAKRSSGINSLADFEGKKLGIWRSSSNLITRAFLKENDINMQLVPIEWSINLFLQGAVDVINAMSYNEYHLMLQSGLKEEDLFIADLHELGYTIPDGGFYVTPQFYSEHPEQCKAFMQATKDGWLYAFSHPEETIDVVMELMHKAKIRANRAHQLWTLQKIKTSVMPTAAEIGILKPEDYRNAINLLKQEMDFSRDLPFEEFYPNGAEKRK
ncbi:MAG: ABC transporter substrate-binding protein [Candidatus Cloacimonadaceae bacterium]|jgi:NitT/TauT family transport system substrate-binding protein|nr:ABC transporter substrate-binding protein [Candidatus Cloacimonadota bacterium]MDY0127271.1 ABC transporter substrate-binding protein [Candidatus Cloacimonadaceae bacterium]MCB5255213.1 ABC transporter substrate-binding protein [Candidatus Cloacimonadota bacterium]MCK9177842.1 ABC transporter substrate-binding protein [Candidatus Cloacimonadota bacterium]MCK9243489.1 ABC transporter substrate-binding protein [Candidatus Cloacimonadota bacterium]